MADDIAVLGIGLDSQQATKNAKEFDKALTGIDQSSVKLQKNTQSMTASFFKAQVALEALKVGARFVVNQFQQSVQVGATFEQQMAKVGAVSKATSQELKDLTASALKMGETTQFTATQSAEALEAMAKAGIKVNDAISALPQVLNLSASSGVSLGESANIVTNIMSAMGQKVEDLNHVNNVLVQTFTSTNTELTGLANTFQYAGGIAKTTGVSIEELSAITGILGNVGIDASKAGTALRSSMSRLIKPTTEAKKVLNDLGVETGQNLIKTLEQLEEKGATSKDIITLFGQEAGASLLSLKQGGGIQAVNTLANELRNVGDIADEVAKKQMDTLQGSFKLLDSAIEGVRISIFNENVDLLKIGVRSLSELIKTNKEEFVSMARAMQQGGTFLVSIGKDIVGVNTKFSGLSTTIKVLVSGVMALGSAFDIVGEGIGTHTFAIKELLSTGDLIQYLSEIGAQTETAKIKFDALKVAINGIWKENKKNETVSEEAIKKVKISSFETAKNTTTIKENEEAKKEAVTATEILNNFLSGTNDEEQELNDNLNATTNSIMNQSEAINNLSNNYKVATEEVKAYNHFSGASFVGETFSVTTRNTPTQSGNSNTSSVGGSSSQAQSQKVNTLLNDYNRLSGVIADYMNKDVSLDIKLKDAETELRGITEELARLGTTDLERQLDLMEQALETQLTIDDLQTDISRNQEQTLRDQKSSAENLNNILGTVLSDLDDLNTGDLSNALPVERLKDLENQFNATKTAIDGIDWSEITGADQQLIAQFQNVSKEFLGQASEVFKSSDNYKVIRDSVKGEMDGLASDLVVAMAKADPTTFKNNMALLESSISSTGTTAITAKSGITGYRSEVYYSGVNANGSKTQIDGFGTSIDSLGSEATAQKTNVSQFETTLGSLKDSFASTDTTISDTDQTTKDLADSMISTQSPLDLANQNFSNVATNTALTVDFIAQKFASLKTAIDEGASSVGGGSTLPDGGSTPTEPEAEFLRYSVDYSRISGGSAINAIFSDRTERLGFVYDTELNKSGTDAFVDIDGNTLQFDIGGLGSKQTYVNGIKSLALGAWDVNEPTQNATLHGGEMVIRSEDSPSVRNFLQSSGQSGKYGAPSSSSGNSAPNMDTRRMFEMLSDILEALKAGMTPNVFLSARKVSEELDIYKGVTA